MLTAKGEDMASYVSETEVPGRVKALLDEGKTQKQLADEWGISQAYLCDVLQGRRGAGPAILKALGLAPTRYYRKQEK